MTQQHDGTQIPPVSPYLVVDGALAAIEFYKQAFGATEAMKMMSPDGGKVMHATLLINSSVVMLSDDVPEMTGGKARSPKALGGTPGGIHLNVPDVDAAFAQAVEAGATITMPLEDQFWGDRYGRIQDPFGHEWSLATPKFTPTMEEIEAAMKAMMPATV